MGPGSVSVGGDTSRLTGTDRLAGPPSLVALQVNVVPAVSEVRVVVAHPVVEVTGVSASLTVQLTVASLTYHPFVPTVPVTVTPMTGGVVSTSRWRVPAAERDPRGERAVTVKGNVPLEAGPGSMVRGALEERPRVGETA